MVNPDVSYDEVDRAIFDDFLYAFEHNCEAEFAYAGSTYCLNYNENGIVVYEDKEGSPEFCFADGEDFMEHFLLDGVPFKNKIPELEEYSVF